MSFPLWKRRFKHTLTAGSGAGTNYQMNFTAHYGAGTNSGEHFYCDGVCNADFSDIRFTDESNNLYTYKLCSKVDSDYAVFVVKVTDNLDSDVTMYVYFGNAAAVDASSDNALIDVVTGVATAYPMDETGGGTVTDYSGNSNTGTKTGTTVVASPFYVGRNALSFDGSDDIITTGTAAYVNTTAGTMFVKVKPLASPDDFDRILSNGGGATTRCFLGFMSGKFWYRLGDLTDTIGDTNAVAGTAYTAALTWYVDGVNKAQFYLNGVTDDTLMSGFNFTGVGVNYNIAAAAATFNHANIVLSHAIYFNTNITATNIANMSANYPDVTLVPGSVLVRKWATTTLPTHGAWQTGALSWGKAYAPLEFFYSNTGQVR